MKKNYLTTITIYAIASVAFSLTAYAEQTNLRVFNGGKAQAGRVAFFKPSEAKIIEIGSNGQKTWEYKIPRKYLNANFGVSAGPDVEWVAKTDTFLVAIPKSGIIEVDRQGNVVWEYMTKNISHDVDLLRDGTLIFVNGWDSDNDYVVTRINRKGEILERYTATDMGLNKKDRLWNDNAPGRAPEPYSNTHANAVQDLGNGKFLLSLRNYHRAVVIDNGRIVRSYNQAKRIHDPVDAGDRLFFIRRETVDASGIVMHDKKTGKRSIVFNSPDASWTPLRTLEILKNGNFLVTGSTVLAQVTQNGEVVWQVDLPYFEHQVQQNRKDRDFVYKAAFVYK